MQQTWINSASNNQNTLHSQFTCLLQKFICFLQEIDMFMETKLSALFCIQMPHGILQKKGAPLTFIFTKEKI